jgi:hypothetical protein
VTEIRLVFNPKLGQAEGADGGHWAGATQIQQPSAQGQAPNQRSSRWASFIVSNSSVPPSRRSSLHRARHGGAVDLRGQGRAALDAAVVPCLPAECRTSPAIRAGLQPANFPRRSPCRARWRCRGRCSPRSCGASIGCAAARAGDVTRQHGAGAEAERRAMHEE